MSDWLQAPRSAPALLPGEVHLWRMGLDREVGALESLLSADERERALGYVSSQDRQRFVAGRGMVRRILGAYLAEEPGRLRFQYGAHGKPELLQSRFLRFNLSHSAGLAVLAVSRRPVGVDVEQVRPFAGMPNPERAAAFFDSWTRREAEAKAAGAAPSEPASGGWWVRSFAPAPGFAGALAAREPVEWLTCWTLTHGFLSGGYAHDIA